VSAGIAPLVRILGTWMGTSGQLHAPIALSPGNSYLINFIKACNCVLN